MNRYFSRILFSLILVLFNACASTKPDHPETQLPERGDAETEYQLKLQKMAEYNPGAQYELGRMYLYGQWLPQSDIEAVKWFRKAADQGMAEAQYQLANMYAHGRGELAKDDTQAVAWLRKAADQGLADAQYTLGGMYALGKAGVVQDPVQSYIWIELAAKQGHAKAIEAQKKIIEVLPTSQLEEVQRLSREWAAAHPK